MTAPFRLALTFPTLALLTYAQCTEPLRDFLPEQSRFWTSPKRVTKRQIPWIILAGASTAALIGVDAKMSNSMPNTASQTRWGGRVSNTGGAIAVTALGGGLLLAGAVSKDTHFKQTGFAAGEAVAHAFVINYALKAAFSRERPGTGSGRGRFWQAYDKAAKGDTSFPSGHATTSWALASAIHHRYPNRKFVPWLVYGYAAAVSASRIPARKHYVSDAIAGSAAGFLIGRFVARRYDAKTGVPKLHSRTLVPQIVPQFAPSQGTAAVALVWGSP